MSLREIHELRRVAHALDERALRILTDGNRHAREAIGWAIRRVPEMAGFKASELSLGAQEVYRT